MTEPKKRGPKPKPKPVQPDNYEEKVLEDLRNFKNPPPVKKPIFRSNVVVYFL